MIIMSSEVEKLRAELANAEKRARAAMAADAKPSNLTFLVVYLKFLVDTTEYNFKICSNFVLQGDLFNFFKKENYF